MKQLEIWYDGEESSKVTIEMDDKEYCFVKYKHEKGYIYCTTSDVNKFIKWLKEDKWSDDEILDLLSRNSKRDLCIAWRKELAKEIEENMEQEKQKWDCMNIKVERSNN